MELIISGSKLWAWIALLANLELVTAPSLIVVVWTALTSNFPKLIAPLTIFSRETQGVSVILPLASTLPDNLIVVTELSAILEVVILPLTILSVVTELVAICVLFMVDGMIWVPVMALRLMLLDTVILSNLLLCPLIRVIKSPTWLSGLPITSAISLRVSKFCCILVSPKISVFKAAKSAEVTESLPLKI